MNVKVLIEGHRKDKLKHIDPKTIIIGERFRVDLGDIEELLESVRTKGIIQPVSIDENLRLLAGGRRTHVALKLGLPTIPVIIRSIEDDLDYREIELMENIHRKDFTWQEQAKLTAEIDLLYKKKYPDWSLRKTAELMDKAPSATSRHIQLAKAMSYIPEIAEQKTADDALKMLKKLEENAAIEELRRRQKDRVNSEATAAPGIDRGVAAALKAADAAYIIGSCFDGMAKLKSNGHISIIECDPPYGIDLNEQKAGKGSVTSTVTGYEEVPRDQYQEFLDKLTNELFRVAAKDCWLVFWYGPTWHHEVITSLRKAGWLVDEIPSIWVKPNGQTLHPELYYARCYEPFFLCRKGKPVMAERGRSNVFQFAGAKNKYHPTQRPTDLIEEILKTLSIGMDTVFVPFLGSGATLRAVFNMGLKGFGFDLDGKYKDKYMLAVEEDTRKLFINGE